MALNQPPIQVPLVIADKTPEVWIKWFSSITRALGLVRTDGSIAMASLLDADAANNSLYYSLDQSKLVYKDSTGTVNDLY